MEKSPVRLLLVPTPKLSSDLLTICRCCILHTDLDWPTPISRARAGRPITRSERRNKKKRNLSAEKSINAQSQVGVVLTGKAHSLTK